MPASRRKTTSLSVHDVGAVKSRLQLTERRLKEAVQQGKQLRAEKVRKQRELEALLEELTTLKNDQHELLLRAVEARLLVDNNSATKADLAERTSASRGGGYVMGGGVCVQDGALQHLRATKSQRLNEVAELERTLASLTAQSSQLDDEIDHYDDEANFLTSQTDDYHADRERNQSHIDVLKSSVSDALRAL